MAITMPTMPYKFDTLEPHLGRLGLKLHFDLYHQTSVELLNAAIVGSPFSDYSLYRIVRKAWAQAPRPLLKYACEALNHEFYWKSMMPGGGGPPTGRIVEWIGRSYGDSVKFMREIQIAAMDHPGDGWLWVVLDLGRLKILTTNGITTPISYGHLPLLALDLCQHAYDLDYGQQRDRYVDAFFRHLVNWQFANDILTRAEAACAEKSETKPMASRSGNSTRSAANGRATSVGATGSRRLPG